MFSSIVHDVEFDPVRLVEAYEQVLSRAEPVGAGRDGDRLTSISLTHRPDAVSPLTDGNESQFAKDGSLRYLERDFGVFNKMFLDTYFLEVYNQVPFEVGRMRLMFMDPLRVYRMHQDASLRAHLAVITNPDAYLVGPAGETVRVPVDGRVRLFDTKLRHTAFNAGDVVRVHLVMAVAGSEEPHRVQTLGSGRGRR